MVVGGDGANWIETGGEEFANAVVQLDGFHLARACGRGFGKELGAQVYQAIRSGDSQKANQLIDSAEPTDNKTARKDRKYVKANVLKGIDWRQRVQQVPCSARGLGTMESNGDKLIANRMKKRGMSWTIKGAHHMAKVIQLRRNGELSSMCTSRIGPASPKQPSSPMPTSRQKPSDSKWLQATIPALVGPHHSRPWVQSLRSLAHDLRN